MVGAPNLWKYSSDRFINTAKLHCSERDHVASDDDQSCHHRRHVITSQNAFGWRSCSPQSRAPTTQDTGEHHGSIPVHLQHLEQLNLDRHRAYTNGIISNASSTFAVLQSAVVHAHGNSTILTNATTTSLASDRSSTVNGAFNVGGLAQSQQRPRCLGHHLAPQQLPHTHRAADRRC